MMLKKIKKFVLLLLVILVIVILFATSYILWIQPIDSHTSGTTIGIARKTTASPKKLVKLKKIRKPNRKNSEVPRIDLRSKDLTELDLTDYAGELSMAIFDSETQWPEKLPIGFDPKKCLELGKNPGLGVRALHKKGITGKGISIGIIDQTLLTSHEQYAKRLKHYEEIHVLSKNPEMHGTAVSSLALGKNIGVAPASNLYFIASALSDNNLKMLMGKDNNDPKVYNYAYYAQAIDRFLVLNESLPEKEKIRVISISRSFEKNHEGYQTVQKSIDKAKARGIFVITANLKRDYNVGLSGLGRDQMADPDDPDSYTLGDWIKPHPEEFKDDLFVPMDRRTYAASSGVDQYEQDASGGLSWAVPYLAGLYALACQADPSITPEKFLDLAMKTSDSRTVENMGKPFTIKSIVNPERLINTLQAN